MTTRRIRPLLAISALAGAALLPLAPASAGTAVTCDGQVATIVGTAGDDHLRGTAGHDVIAGLGGNDTIKAGGGDDVICGGDGDDVVEGGHGNDTMFGQAGKDSLNDNGGGVSEMSGGPGNDDLQTEASAGGHYRGGAGNDFFFIVGQHEHLLGGPGNDQVELLSAFWNDMSMSGGSGHDLMTVDLERHSTDGPGYRIVTADLARGRFTANHTSVPMTGFEDIVLNDQDLSPRSELSAVSRKYVIDGTSGPNDIFAGVSGHHAPPVWIFGRGGDDVLHGGSGPDLLNGGPGHDEGNGGNGHDVCRSIEVQHNCEA